jgi:hypothetical protein
MITGPQQRQEGLDHEPGPVQVGLRRLADHRQVGGAGSLPGVVGDGRVVDQDVELAVPLADVARGGGHAGLVGDVKPQRLGCDSWYCCGWYCCGGATRGADGTGRAAGRLGVAGGQDHRVAALGQLAADFPANAPIAAGNQADRDHRPRIAPVVVPRTP